ncbi:hypothetical protein [Ascidiimonas aurantiaca]|uniref:hypothetical protein n=1 Tax=Ascidiimonas aurantiaca TaxID=1685432 RepID=UPI0030ECD96F
MKLHLANKKNTSPVSDNTKQTGKQYDNSLVFRFQDNRHETKKIAALENIAGNSTPVQRIRHLQKVAGDSQPASEIKNSVNENPYPVQPKLKKEGSVQKTVQFIRPGEAVPTQSEEREAYRTQENLAYVAGPADKKISATPSSENKKQLSTALANTSFIKFLLRLLPGKSSSFSLFSQGTKEIEENSEGLTVATAWENLVASSNITVNYHDDLGGYAPMDDHEESLKRKEEEKKVKSIMTARLVAANAIIHQIVDPVLLVKMRPPKVTIMMEPHQRAYQADDGIKIANGDGIHLIVHEIGHYIENNYPKLWEDAAMFRRRRAHEAGNTVTAEENDKGMEEEGRMAGAYPVTGKYTSKIYEALGSTEVVSMTMEYMSSKEKLSSLLKDDPQQLGIILRRIQPNDEELEAVFDRFHEFFPNSDSDREAIDKRESEREHIRRYPDPLREPLLKKQ